MTVMGWTVSTECAAFIKEAEEKLSKRVLYMNEPLEGKKTEISAQNPNLYFILFDMNRIEIGIEFESLIKEQLKKLLLAEAKS